MSHKHVDNLAEKIKANRASKGVNADSVQDSVETVKGVVDRKPLQKSTERAHAVEQLHFSFFLEDLGRDPMQSLSLVQTGSLSTSGRPSCAPAP